METETLDTIPTDTATLDAIIFVANGRNYFDEKEIKQYITTLNDKGIDEHQLTGKLSDRVRSRMFVSGGEVMDVMLDIRNIVAPPSPVVVGEILEAAADDVESTDS